MSRRILEASTGPSALGRRCTGLIEACWLTATVAVPLLFNPQARDGFDPFKAVFLRLFAIVILAAWTIRAADRHAVGQSWLEFRPTPLRQTCAAAFLGFCLSLVASTTLSVYPSQSFWGSFQQRQGTLTELCCLVFFLAVAMELRSEAQVRRLITALLVPTIPISLHAIMQRVGFDPLPLTESAGGRVFSLSGNPIYLAAYLGMVFPFTVSRILDYVHWKGANRPLRVAGLVFYGILGALQVSAFLFTESRGPLLGMVAGASFLAVAHGAVSNRKRLATMVAIAALGIAFLAIIGTRSRPSASVDRLPVLSRLAGALQGGMPTDEAGSERIDLWKQAAQILMSPEPVRSASGTLDRWTALRPLVGYGPETLECVLPQKFSFGSPAMNIMSRFHNHFWDRWYSFGMIGVLSFLALVVLAFGAAFRRLGSIRSPSDWGRFLAVVAFSAAGLGGVLVAYYGPGFLGLGVMCGLALGLTLYLVFWGLLSAPLEPAFQPADARVAPMLSALAALVSHLVETGFAFPVTATALLFWICLGVAMGLSVQGKDPVDIGPARTANRVRRPWGRAVLRCSIGAALTTAVLAFAFVYITSLEPISIRRALSVSLTRIRFGERPSHLMAIVLLPGWIGATFAFWAEEARQARGTVGIGAFYAGAIISGVAGALGAIAKAAQIGSIGRAPDGIAQVAAALAQGWRYEVICVGMLVVSLLFLAVWGWCLCESDCARPQSLTRREPWTVFATIAAAAVLVWFACINPVRANALAGWANALNGGGKLSAAVGVYRRAVDLDPHAYVYRFELAELLAASAGKAAFDENMAEAESLLKEGRKISSLDQGALILGDIYERWAAAVNRPARRLALAMQARRSFEAALAFKPAEEFALVDMAALDELLLNDPIGAADALKRADTLVPDRAASDWFDYYAQESARSSLPEFRRFYAKRALWCCGEALESAARQNQSEFSLIVRRGMLHSSLGELRLALADYRLAVNEDHDPDDWKAEALLAQTYGELGDRDSAIWHAGEAIDKAPEGVRPTLEALRARVGGP